MPFGEFTPLPVKSVYSSTSGKYSLLVVVQEKRRHVLSSHLENQVLADFKEYGYDPYYESDVQGDISFSGSCWHTGSTWHSQTGEAGYMAGVLGTDIQRSPGLCFTVQ